MAAAIEARADGEAASRAAALADHELAIPALAAEEAHPLSIGGHARRQDNRGFVYDRAHRKLESCRIADAPDNRHGGAVRTPIRPDDIRVELAWCAAGERGDGEGRYRFPPVHGWPPHRDRELTLSGHGEKIGRRQVDRSGLRAAQLRGIEPIRLAVPRRAVDDAAAVGCEPRLADIALTERHPTQHADSRSRRFRGRRHSRQPARRRRTREPRPPRPSGSAVSGACR